MLQYLKSTPQVSETAFEVILKMLNANKQKAADQCDPEILLV